MVTSLISLDCLIVSVTQYDATTDVDTTARSENARDVDHYFISGSGDCGTAC